MCAQSIDFILTGAYMQKYPIVINTNTNLKTQKKNIRFEHELLFEIESVKAKKQSFSSWVKQACRNQINQRYNSVESVRTLDDNVEDLVRTDVDATLDNEAQALALYWLSRGLFHQQISNKLNQLEMKTTSGHAWTRVAVRSLCK
ncbi:hypothetical protein BTN98_12545 [Photobacterium aquimaris]|uniref:Uncharacterized protein n=2 Tax=Photobacterium aquimaris TaxID=512643 RepID=A0A2T3HWF8_9GAMM|nr:hypothetical protein AYY21_03075 [Photobacterium aquimaris]PQJ38271.1 hypothetical protein BTN98_12545 [Photobacterium aquimaris]PSU03234.1 hypothetical protein C0W81_12545 [Photobacterium aquimaris]